MTLAKLTDLIIYTVKLENECAFQVQGPVKITIHSTFTFINPYDFKSFSFYRPLNVEEPFCVL